MNLGLTAGAMLYLSIQDTGDLAPATAYSFSGLVQGHPVTIIRTINNTVSLICPWAGTPAK